LDGLHFRPCLLLGPEGMPVDFHCLPLTMCSNLSLSGTMNETLDAYYTLKYSGNRIRQKKEYLGKVMKAHLERCNRKAGLQEEQIQGASRLQVCRTYGELLTANLYRLENGISHATLEDYSREGNPLVEIPLDPSLSPGANAKKYFKEYAKARNILAKAEAQLEKTRQEALYIANVLFDIEEANSLAELEQIQKEIMTEGYLKTNVPRPKAAPGDEFCPDRYRSSDGFEILVGRNNRQNDELTLHRASSKDIWMHARNIPGAHVVVKQDPGREISETTLREAAAIAAWHSRYRNSGGVSIDYTQIRNVKKPTGAKPGMVIYHRFSTLYVRSDKDLIIKLKEGNDPHAF
ncbi:MAG TPA: fibronectin/fibrinogen-binding protein, partial [Clostridiales bacterium]|nr:fibronectin/fibrinogen-binding protein [Clostridiales bacterium]